MYKSLRGSYDPTNARVRSEIFFPLTIVNFYAGSSMNFIPL